MRRLGAVVLAAGEGRRFGGAKQLLRWGRATLVERAVANCLQAGCEEVVVVTGAHADAVGAAVTRGFRPRATGGVRLVHCAEWGRGMSASIACGARALAENLYGFDALLIVLPDQPLVDARLLRRLVDAQRGCDAAAVRYRSGPGVPACLGRELYGRVEEVSGVGGAKALLRDPGVRCRAIEAAGRVRDVDTAGEWEQLAAERPAGISAASQSDSPIEWVTGEVQSGKTTALAARIAANPDTYCGLLAPVDARGDRWLRDVVSGERRRLTCAADARDAVAVGRFHFSGEVFAWGREVLERHCVAHPGRTLVIDELGKLELRGEGLAPACWRVIGERLASGGRVVAVVRAGLAGVIAGG